MNPELTVPVPPWVAILTILWTIVFFGTLDGTCTVFNWSIRRFGGGRLVRALSFSVLVAREHRVGYGKSAERLLELQIGKKVCRGSDRTCVIKC